jgi:2-polyprenyl-3-methyl-5-hydroxy-6-metoxy-1,4-benzoquinol methylase
MNTREETWDGFWAQALRIDMFADQQAAYRKVADSRAEWLETTFKLDRERPVLSLACGEGGIELALARRGYSVVGIDRSQVLISQARDEAIEEGLSATFILADLTQESQLPGNNGTVLCFDTLGLLSNNDEFKIVQRMAGSLHRDGVLLIDNPLRESLTPTQKWQRFKDGYFLLETSFDKESNTHLLNPIWISPEGEEVLLRDPYDNRRPSHTGMLRYVYTPSELVNLVKSTGLPARDVRHQRNGYFMVVGSRLLD